MVWKETRLHYKKVHKMETCGGMFETGLQNYPPPRRKATPTALASHALPTLPLPLLLLSFAEFPGVGNELADQRWVFQTEKI